MAEIKINVARVGFIQTNCYFILNDETKKGIIVDPGDEADYIEDCVKQLEMVPEALFLTHAHYDHIGAVGEIKEKYKVPVYVHEADIPMLEDKSKNMGMTEYHLRGDDVILHGGEELDIAGMKIQVIHTPGHTPGGVCYYFKGNSFLISGDTLFRFSWGRTDFPGGDERAIMSSIREKLLPLPEDTRVFPGHDSPTRIGDERRIHGYKEQI